MGRIDELVSEEFARWEQRGRGWQVWPEPVQPEPPFEEFAGYRLSSPSLADDGRKPSWLASLFDSLQSRVHPQPPELSEESIPPEPAGSREPLTVVLVASLPARLDIGDDTMRAVVDSLEACSEPTAFELFGREDGVSVQFVSSPSDAPVLARQLHTFLPEVPFSETEVGWPEAWDANGGIGFIVDFGLAHEFMLPLRSDHRLDPFLGLVAVLGELSRNEVAVFQVLFQPVQHAWAASAWRSVTDGSGKALFINRPHLIPGTKEKFESPLFGAVVRLAAKADTFERATAIVRDLALALRAYAKMESNRLIPLTNDAYPFDAHEEDLLRRQSRRSGMLLNREELIGFVHLPGEELRSPKLRRQSTRTKSPPPSVLSRTGVLLGTNTHNGKTTEVRLTPEQRVRHTHIIGKTGTGKSTLLFNLIRDDIDGGRGVAVLDPHGDLVEKILGIIPQHRLDDVVLLDPSDEAFSVSFNILSAHSDFEKNLLASDLVSVFRRLCSSWGDQMGSVLNNAILAFLESSQGGTLADLRRFLLDKEFRRDFLATVRDPDIVYYWRKGFPQLGGNKSIGPVLTRLETFLSPKPIRYMVSQKTSKLDFAKILDSGKIFLAKLPEGQIGKENSFLLGSLIMAKFQQMAMSRQRMRADERHDFFVYLDEFQNFITHSMSEILSGARKYRVGLILAHQDLHQLQRDSDVASAVLSNPCTRIVFQVGDADAHALEKGFSSFEAKDLQNLDIGQAICRIERSDGDFNLRIPLPEDPDAAVAATTRERVVTRSREKYGTPRAEVEAEMFRNAELNPPTKPPAKEKVARPKQGAAAPSPEARSIPSLPVSPEMPPVANEPEAVPPPPLSEILKSAPVHSPETHTPPRQPIPGRGGREHQRLQKQIKEEAEQLGFRSILEQPVLDGQANIDVWLERNGLIIACEVSFTNTEENESSKIIRCLKGGIPGFAVICTDEKKLRKLEAAVSGGIESGWAARVQYFQPAQFFEHLRSLPIAPPKESERIRRGYKVKHSYPSASPEEHKLKEEAAIRAIAESMQSKEKK